MEMQLGKIFEGYTGNEKLSRNELCLLELSKEFMQFWMINYELIYQEDSGRKSNVCFANNDALLPDYKDNYSKVNIVDYISIMLKRDEFDFQQDVITMPEDATDFWKIVFKKNDKIASVNERKIV